jgi:hypothetical protein
MSPSGMSPHDISFAKESELTSHYLSVPLHVSILTVSLALINTGYLLLQMCLLFDDYGEHEA